MKKNQFLAILSAITMTAISVTPVFSSAMAYFVSEHSPRVQKILDCYELIDDKGLLTSYRNDKTCKLYMRYADTTDKNYYYMFETTEEKYNKVAFTIDHDLYYYDEFIGILESYGYSNIHDEFDKPEYKEFTSSSEILMEETSPYLANFYMVAYDELPYEESLKQAKEVCEVLKEKGFISGGQYFERNIHFNEFDPNNLTYYYCEPETIDEQIEAVQKYIDENNFDCTVIKSNIEYDSNYEVVPNKLITPQEHMNIAIELKNQFGIVPYLTMMDSFGGLPSIPDDIEPESTVAGDVNLDGKVDIADIVAISAYTGDAENNSFKSEQQIINGDVHNTGDGLTANDALMIQQYLAGMIDSLE